MFYFLLSEIYLEYVNWIYFLKPFLLDEPHYKDAIRESNGIPVFINLLKSHELDRVHAAVVALSFLSVDNVKNCICMFDNGALPYLITGMKSNIDGMKAACAQTCRNIFVLDKNYKKEFLKLGGITQLVNLLELSSTDDNQPLYTQLEAIYHLEDFILNDGDEVPQFLEAVKKSDAIKNLKALQQCPEQDLAEASNVLLLRLTD
ncbi:armadillo-domain containing rhoptry protein [Plasmodium yoelii yoelii]|uniref:Armadillo-domain containing rhoptry protein n=1 Tax=Plasmodium yoelii yoelii TaxID=73239 RepID=A0AAF0B1F3_PLAYO|nr:armadillo-domain containing rhoptry protein [Plasmodium yoelii yoelii]